MEIRTQKAVNNLEHRINMTVKYSTFVGLYEALTNATEYVNNIKLSGISDSYIKGSLLVSLTESVFPSIKKDFENNRTRRMQVTKEVSYAVGLFSSLIVTVGNCGSGYFLTFGINLVRNTASTFLIDKLNKLGQVDGLSIAVIIGFLCEIPKVVIQSLQRPVLETTITIVSMASLFGINYKLLKSNKEIPVLYNNGKEEKISLGISSVYSSSIFASSILVNVLTKFNVPTLTSYTLTFLLIPVACYVLSNENNISDKITKYLGRSGGVIPMVRPGRETKEFINNKMIDVNLKYGIIGSMVFIASHLLISVFSLPLSPMYMALIVNSTIRVSYSIKAMISVNGSKKGFLK